MKHREYLPSRKRIEEKTVHPLQGQGMKGETEEAANTSGDNMQSDAMFLLFPKFDMEQGGNKIKNLRCSHLILTALLAAACFAKTDLQRDKFNPPHHHWSFPHL